jgi:hypothetical protein
MTHYEMAEKLSEKMGVSLEKATQALEACDWELLDAALMLEKEIGQTRQEAWTSCDTTAEEPNPDQEARERRRGVVEGLGTMIRDLFNLGNRNRFEVRKDDKLLLEVPVTVLVLLLIFAFWVCIPLLVIGLFAGCRYSFSGAELGRESVNNAMDKAAEAVERVQEEVTREH